MMSIINNKKVKIFLSFFLLFICFSCAKRETVSANEIITKSIKYHGGITAWKSIKTLSFDKKVTLFYKDGSVEFSTIQFQEFNFFPELSGKIQGGNSLILYQKGIVKKYVNDSLVSNKEELERAKNSFFASQYVISQPFSLLDENVTLNYLGLVKFNGKEVYEVKVKYDGDTNESDKWIYYFDKETFKVVANKVIRPDHTSLVNNLTFNNSTAFVFNENRKSYRLNTLGEKTYLRAEYFYSILK